MKTLKLQQEIMRDLEKHRNKKQANRWCCFSEELEKVSFIGITDGFRMFLIDKEEFYIDLEKLNKLEGSYNSVIPSGEYEKAELTRELKRVEMLKTNAVKIKSGNFETLVNEKYIEMFEKNATLEIAGDIQPVKVYENGVLRGIILPMKDN